METYRKRGQPVSGGLVDWKLERFLGKGAFGEVWMGRNPGHPEPRAFKFFTQPGASDWLIAREQRTLYRVRAQLNRHPNIVEFIDVITRGTQCPFLVLEYVGGGSLEEWILARSHRPPLKKQEIMVGVIRGLSEAHTAGIYHRDLKPANVLLTPGPDVQAKIADFGLGLAEGEGEEAAGSPASEGILVGTTMYLPPEALQPFIRREPAQDDVFALGVLWYQFLVERLERPPYDFADHLRVAGVDSHTIRLIQRCLAHPDWRFADGCEVEAALIEIPEVIWNPPQGCFDISFLAREYLAGLPR
jgi:serine/threonine protein kinase